MGNEIHSKSQSKQPLHQIPESDIISDIFEPQPSTLEQRTKLAIRISQQQRIIEATQSTGLAPLNSTNSKQMSEPTLQDLCKLNRVTSSRHGGQKYVLEGVLIKEEPSFMFKQFTERYCFLTEKKFIYNENNARNGERAGTLNFDLLSCVIEVNAKNQKVENFRIKVNGSEKLFLFHGATEAESRKWIQLLSQVTDKSFGKQYNLTYLSHYHRFWRKEYLSQKQFREQAQTGDLLLMRGLTQTAVMQRAITQQQYDHVALVIKNIKNQVLLFEANGAVGVGVLPWHRFISKKYYKQQEIVVFRKLKVQRTPEFYQQFEQFVQRNMGRKYKFSVKKYIMNRQSDSQDQKSYFCSSLVAKLYKNIQLLDEKISSMQYMPHSFTEKQGLQLRQNGRFGPAKLGRENIIVFEKLFFQKSN